jgi:hypothetical protein
MHRKALTALLGAVTISALLLAPSAASAWAPAETAPIHPGVMTFTDGAQCTSNFIFQDGSNVYIGQAAHCSGTGAATETNGCETESLPIGTPVEVDGATEPGTLAYNSWITMQQKGETDEETCAFNDFALVKLDPADVPNVNPSVPALAVRPAWAPGVARDLPSTPTATPRCGAVSQRSARSRESSCSTRRMAGATTYTRSRRASQATPGAVS